METKEFMSKMVAAVEKLPPNVTNNFIRNYGQLGFSLERIVLYICITILAGIFLAS